MGEFSGNEAGTGGLVTFKDSNWLMSFVLYHQPHFAGQPKDLQVFWGYSLHPDRIGNFVAKSMSDCTGAEILTELCGHLNFDRTVFDGATCIPCRLPYITSMFMPRGQDGPSGAGARELEEPRLREPVRRDSGRRCVHGGVFRARRANGGLSAPRDRAEIPPITRHDKSIRVLIETVEKAFV